VQLGLNGWPPLVSHFFCLVLGFVFANFKSLMQEVPVRLPKNSVVLTFEAKRLERGALPQAGDVVYIGKQIPGQPSACRLARHPSRVLAVSDLVSFRLDASDSAFVAAAILTKKQGPIFLQLLNSKAGETTPLCGRLPQVVYEG